MDVNKKKHVLQRGGALLLVAVLLISAMTGCAGAKKSVNASEQAKTQQSRQTVPKTKTEKKDNSKRSNPGKAAGGQNSPVKPKDNRSNTAKPSVPVIQTQPKSVTVASGSSFTFSVFAIGEDLKYSWQVNKNDGRDWTDIPDTDNASYTVKNAEKEQNGWKYRCVITNNAGKAESTAAVLTVDPSVKAKQG